MDAAEHAVKGAVVCTGGLTLLQSLANRRVVSPSPLALSLGSFVGTFRFLEALGRTHDKRDSAAPAAASTAAIVALFFLEANRKGMVISYAAVEALISLAKEHTRLAEIKGIEMPLGTLVYARIIHMWIYCSQYCSRSQLSTLDGLSHVSKDALSRMRVMLPASNTVSRCQVFHPMATCSQFHRDFLLRNFKSSLKMFIPMYLLSSGVLQYKRWLSGPRPSLKGVLIQYLRSCACLTSVYAIPLASSCLLPIQNNRLAVTISGSLAVLCLLVEHERRRVSVLKAISVYPIAATATQVAEALRLSEHRREYLQYVIFAASMGVIFQYPQHQGTRLVQWLYGHALPVTQTHIEATDNAEQEKQTRDDVQTRNGSSTK
ncbi:hypothetical protein Poli38472_008858 [Pythium oligandrum]|uniref:Transmembrane protein 135 N-terminal domain-containing protein n=1 Tax=Pythium oligandrum TaxID=41045 RepID=A0A8K1C4F4_PYTOL|nr:hypothetical protein Poli38472_008858 [Pythium oligandrum]|eukprot:TMW56210.1 hypothetical protein Poli38472_008858 [Pythium oligandrum]